MTAAVVMEAEVIGAPHARKKRGALIERNRAF
jgi:bacterioferritin-associated ferredoxin